MNIKKIAEKLGVSTATVSRAINDRYGVSSKTKKKVLDLIRKFDYHPNIHARRLVSQRSHSIGLIFPYNDNMFTDPYLTELTSYIQNYVIKNGYDFVLLFFCAF